MKHQRWLLTLEKCSNGKRAALNEDDAAILMPTRFKIEKNNVAQIMRRSLPFPTEPQDITEVEITLQKPVKHLKPEDVRIVPLEDEPELKITATSPITDDVFDEGDEEKHEHKDKAWQHFYESWYEGAGNGNLI